MYISKKLLKLLWNINHFLGTDDRSVYCMIKQEIRSNKRYKNIRFMSEQNFYKCLGIGQALYYQENYDSEFNNCVELYIVESFLKKLFQSDCKERVFEILNSNKSITNRQCYYLISFLSLRI